MRFMLYEPPGTAWLSLLKYIRLFKYKAMFL